MLPAAQALASGPCTGFAPGAQASSLSSVSGLLAAFVFTGIIILMTEQVAGSRGEEAALGLKLLLCAFFGLVIATLLLGFAAGHEDCADATPRLTLFTAMFCTALVVMAVSLTWVITAYERHGQGVLRVLRHLIYLASALVVGILAPNCLDCIQVDVPPGPPPAADIFVWVASGLSFVAALPAGQRIARALLARLTSVAAPPGRRSRATAGTARGGRGPVDRCVWATVGYLAAALIVGEIITSIPLPAGVVVPAVYAVAWVSWLPPLGVLVLALHAMAPGGAGLRPASPHLRGDEALPADVHQEPRTAADQ